MLKKLLKYDLKNTYKVLIIFYSLALFFALLTRILFSIDNSFVMNIIGQVSQGVTISMWFNILINNLMRLWVDFKRDFYGDESYLTHTLPVEKKTLYISKIITSILTLFTSILVIGLTIFIVYYSKENIQFIKKLLMPLSTIYDTSIIKILLAFLFIFFLEFASALQAGYTGIILGHKMNSAKLPFSILFGFITYMLTQVFGLIIIFIVGIFNKDIMNLFNTVDIINIDILKTIIYMAIFIYTIILIICYFVNVNLFKKGVNVD